MSFARFIYLVDLYLTQLVTQEHVLIHTSDLAKRQQVEEQENIKLAT